MGTSLAIYGAMCYNIKYVRGVFIAASGGWR